MQMPSTIKRGQRWFDADKRPIVYAIEEIHELVPRSITGPTMEEFCDFSAQSWMECCEIDLQRGPDDESADFVVCFDELEGDFYAVTTMPPTYESNMAKTMHGVFITVNTNVDWSDFSLLKWTIAHEFGHAIGLSHIHTYDGQNLMEEHPKRRSFGELDRSVSKIKYPKSWKANHAVASTT